MNVNDYIRKYGFKITNDNEHPCLAYKKITIPLEAGVPLADAIRSSASAFNAKQCAVDLNKGHLLHVHGSDAYRCEKALQKLAEAVLNAKDRPRTLDEEIIDSCKNSRTPKSNDVNVSINDPSLKVDPDIRVFFDMDGVVADFDRGVSEVAKTEKVSQDDKTQPQKKNNMWADIGNVPHLKKEISTDAERAANDKYMKKYGKNGDLRTDDQKGVHGFYYQLPEIKGSTDFVKDVYEKIGDNCQMLTGTPRLEGGNWCAGIDKADWAHDHISPSITVNAVMRWEKPRFCRGKQDILIDDNEKNVSEWEEKGGSGIVFSSVPQAREDLKKLLITLTKEKENEINKYVVREEDGEQIIDDALMAKENEALLVKVQSEDAPWLKALYDEYLLWKQDHMPELKQGEKEMSFGDYLDDVKNCNISFSERLDPDIGIEK